MLHNAHTGIGSVANKASHTSKARCFLACDPQRESLLLLKTFIKQLIMLPISPNIHRLGLLPLRKVLPKQNKKQKASRERQVFSLSLGCGHQVSHFTFQFCKCTFRSNSITTQKIAAALFYDSMILLKLVQDLLNSSTTHSHGKHSSVIYIHGD